MVLIPRAFRHAVAVIALGGLAGSASGQVMLNEVYTGTPDWLEIRNYGLQPVDISGWVVQTYITDSSTTPNPETPFTIPNNITIQGYGLLVLQEGGVKGTPGTLPNSIFTGGNYNWIDTRTIVAVLFDKTMVGRDYVYIDLNNGPPAPHLPPNLNWFGNFNTGVSDDHRRNQDADLDNASEWTKTVGSSATPGARNPGQSDCQFFEKYGTGCPGSGGFLPGMRAPTCPKVGEQLDIYIESALGGALSALFVGQSEGSFPLGATGCTLNTSPPAGPVLLIPLGGFGAGGGFATISFLIPPGFTGQKFTMQLLVKDPAGGGGISATTGNRMFMP